MLTYREPSDAAIKSLLEEARTIAVVGLSPNPDRPAYEVAQYLQSQGYRIIPVHPRAAETLGERAYADVTEIPEDIKVDIVDVFVRAENTPPVAEAAVKRGAGALWLQLGIRNDETARIASKGGLKVVMDRCAKIEHKRLIAGE